jgi:hypothetical protein
MSIVQIKVLKNCMNEKHDQCVSNNCWCTCHEERSTKSLRSVNIIPKTYCLKCEHNYKDEIDSCKICGHYLIRQPNYFQKKLKYSDCMGELEYFLWEKNKRELYEARMKKQEEEEKDLWFPPAYGVQRIQNKKKTIKLGKLEISFGK